MNEKVATSKERLYKFTPPKEKWTPIEKALFTPREFYLEYNKTQDLVFEAIKYSFDHHFKNNTIYQRICVVNNFKPDMIKSKDDLPKIPLLPDSFFKDYPAGKEFLIWLDNVFNKVRILIVCAGERLSLRLT